MAIPMTTQVISFSFKINHSKEYHKMNTGPVGIGEAGEAGDLVQEPVGEEQNQDIVPAVEEPVLAKV